MKKGLVSVIIPAYNEENYIVPTLKSINNQSYKNIETIVVCNGCKDKTFQKAIPYADKVLKMKEGHVSKARNLGAKVAKGSTLVFLDADTLLTKNSIEAMLNTNAGVGTCKAKPDVNRLIAKVFLGFKNKFWWVTWSNGIIFCKKKIFDKINGFNENMIKKEDSNFIKRAKEHGPYKLAKTYVIGSMRRHEEWGYFNLVAFWIKETLRPTKEDYGLVR